MHEEKDTIEIDLSALLYAVWKRIWLVVGAVLLGAAMAFSYAAFFVTPLYQARAMMYVNNSSISVGNTSLSISSGELSAAQSLVKTYIVIMESRQNLNAVIEQAQLPYTYEELVEMISAFPVNDTEVFEIVVTSQDPAEAERIANTIAQILPEKISEIVEGSSVKIVDYAIVPAYPVSPSVTAYTLVGFLLAGAVSVGLIIILELLSDSIRSEEYLMQTYDLPVLAVIPAMQKTGKKRQKIRSRLKFKRMGRKKAHVLESY